MKKVKTIEIKNLQIPEIQELSDSETSEIVGGNSLISSSIESSFSSKFKIEGDLAIQSTGNLLNIGEKDIKFLNANTSTDFSYG